MRVTLHTLRPTRLFYDHDLADRLESYRRDAERAVDAVALPEQGSETIETLADRLVEEHALKPLVVLRDQRTKGHRHVVIAAEDGGGSRDLVRVVVPFEGPTPLFYCVPSNSRREAFYAEVVDGTVVLEFHSGEEPRVIARKAEQRLNTLDAWVQAVNTDLERARTRMRLEVLEGLRSRTANRRQAMAALDALDIPTTRVPPHRSVEIPVDPRPIALPARGEDEGTSWLLADDTYERVVETIVRFAHAMERRATSATQLIPDEETLRDWIVFVLNSTYERDGGDDLFVTGETVNGFGKTDILVHQDHRNVFIGECKFWNGPAGVDKAIDQILGYLGWRDVKAALLLFIKAPDASRVIASAHDRVVNHLDYLSSPRENTSTDRRDYLMRSQRDPAVTVRLALIPFVVYVDPSK
jgi:hypothetical protein